MREEFKRLFFGRFAVRSARLGLPRWGMAPIGSMFTIGALLALLWWPPSRRTFVHSPPREVPAYDATVKKIRALIAGTPADIRPKCSVQLLEHGRPTQRVFVLLHGLSNCPAQFAELGRRLFKRGHNVLIARMPYHGKWDRLTTDWARLKALDMLEGGNAAVDLALGLGKKVTAVGLSINGATVAWMAQNRSDLGRAVLLAPFLSPAGIPAWARPPVQGLLLSLPNVFLWWNPKERENFEGPDYVYPRFPTRVIGETMRLGREVLLESRHHPPRSGSILVITTGADAAADNRMTAQLVGNWKRFRPTGVKVFEFPASDKVPHDFIDPNQPNQRTALVYPIIIELLEK